MVGPVAAQETWLFPALAIAEIPGFTAALSPPFPILRLAYIHFPARLQPGLTEMEFTIKPKFRVLSNIYSNNQKRRPIWMDMFYLIDILLFSKTSSLKNEIKRINSQLFSGNSSQYGSSFVTLVIAFCQ